MAVGSASLLRGSVHVATTCNDLQPKGAAVEATVSARPRSQACGQVHAFPAMSAPLRSSKLWQRGSQIGSSSHICPRLPPQPLYQSASERARTSATTTAASSSGNPDTSAESGKAGRQSRTRAREDIATLRERLSDYIEKKAGYIWLVGPVALTSAVALPPAIVPWLALLQKNYFLGLLATLALDVVFVLAADLFFVLADKAGHQHAVAGGPPPPWIGPWEYTGYPKGEPTLTKLVAGAGVGVGALGLLASLFVGKLAVGLPALGPYLALIFIQVAYERLLASDRVPAYPLVPIVYTTFRFKQLARAAELVAAMGGGVVLATTIKALTLVWTLYLAIHVSEIPWLYSTWNSNRAT